MRTHPLRDLRGVAPNLMKDRGQVNIHAALWHHLSHITVADVVLAVLADTRQDALEWKATALKQGQQDGDSDDRILYLAKVYATKSLVSIKCRFL